MGQMRTVKVYRLFMQDSIEERILKMRERPSSTAASAGGAAAGSVAGSRTQELEFLLGKK